MSSSQPGAKPQPLGGRDELRLQLLVDAALDDHPARSGAALARGPERRPDDPLDGEVEIRVVEDDDRVLAAELEMDVLQALGGRLEDGDAGLARAGERDHAHIRVAHERLADLTSSAVDDVQDARGEPRLDEQLDVALAERRRVRRGLEDDRVAATSAGSVFQDGIAIGKFHGVITPTTPIGIRTLIWNLSLSSDGVVCPKRRRPSPPM